MTGADQRETRVGYQRHAGIGYQGQALPLLQLGHGACQRLLLVVLVPGPQRRANTEVLA